MSAKKVATAAAETACAEEKTTQTKTATKRCSRAKKTQEVVDADYINGHSVGFRAGDVYQALAGAGTTMTIDEIAKAANISEREVLLGLGWLFKEGKVKGENVADISLA